MSDQNAQVMPAPSQMVSDRMRLESAEHYNPVTWQGMSRLAKTLIDAKACPVGLDTEAKLMVALQAGREVGISPINSLNSFYIVKGKVSIYGDTAIAVVLRDGHRIDWGKCDATEANVTITRIDNGNQMTGRFTYEDAVRRGLTAYADGRKNEFWHKFPENMLKFKAFGSIARFIVADSLRGMSIKEELEAGGFEEAEVVERKAPTRVEAEIVDTKPQPTAAQHDEVDESESLQEFINKEPEKQAEQPRKRLKDDVIRDINNICLENGKNPKTILEFYKKKRWDEFKLEDLLKLEDGIKAKAKTNAETPRAIETPPSKEPKEEVGMTTYYMPEDDVIDTVNKLLTRIDAGENLNETEMALVNDVSNDKFLGKENPAYKGLF